jgi:hypothetical protein
MELKGYVPTEENHSSICAHLGKGANWLVVEHCSQLVTQQAHLACKFWEIDNCLNICIYKSSLDGQEKKDDELAKKSLSDWAYTEIFEKNLKNAQKLKKNVISSILSAKVPQATVYNMYLVMDYTPMLPIM